MNTMDFIKKSNIRHNSKYDYSLVEYINASTKVDIICPCHGIFSQRANNHISGIGCKLCANHKLSQDKRSDRQIFVDKSLKIHGNRYDYSLVEYINNSTKVKIICPVHGVFYQVPRNHTMGKGCRLCSNTATGDAYRSNTVDFINKSMAIHNREFDYSLVEYINARTKVIIICPKHGPFEVTPDNHISKKSGCPHCFGSISKQDTSLITFIKSIYNKDIITNTRSIIRPYELDIYLPDINKAFEYNGSYWHEEGVRKPIGYHQMKTDMCSNKGIKLIHIWESDWINDSRFMRECIKRQVR